MREYFHRRTVLKALFTSVVGTIVLSKSGALAQGSAGPDAGGPELHGRPAVRVGQSLLGLRGVAPRPSQVERRTRASRGDRGIEVTGAVTEAGRALDR